MTATVYHHLDDIIISHEIGHAIACIVGGFPLLLVVTDRHQLMDFHGKTEYFMRKEGDPLEIARAHGVVAIAGRYSEPWTTNAQAAGDEADLQRIWESIGRPDGWINAVHTDAFILFQRRDVRAAGRAPLGRDP